MRSALDRDISDKMAHSLVNGVGEAVQFLRVTLDHQFDTAAGEVADVTGDIESARQRLAGETEANPLNLA